MEYLIELQHDVEIEGLETLALERMAAHALTVEGVARPSELSIVLADDVEVRELNRAYRGIDEPTDVLSFSQAEGDAFAAPEGTAPHLGDVIISLDTARRQANEHCIELQDEVAHLIVHGILHLLGYDHEVAADEGVMRAHEDAILGAQAGARTHHH